MRIYWSGIWYFRQSLLYYPFLWGDCGRCLDVKQKENLYIRNINKPIDIMHRKQWRTLLFWSWCVSFSVRCGSCLSVFHDWYGVVFNACTAFFFSKRCFVPRSRVLPIKQALGPWAYWSSRNFSTMSFKDSFFRL